MKKTLAILLSITMLFGILAINTVSASTTPTVRVITNYGSPVKDNFETYFTVRFDNFFSIKGIDIIVTATDAEISEVTTYGLPEAVDDINSDKENYDISEDKTTLHFVDFNPANKSRIVFKATSPNESASVSVKGEYATNGETLFDIKTKPGVFEIKKEVIVNDAAKGTLSQPTDNTFIPYGAVYTTSGDTTEFVDKNGDGTFTIPDSNHDYITFDLPIENSDDIAAFGVSTQIEEDGKGQPSLKFGSYSGYDFEGAQHGTMVFEGDWISLKEYYIKNGNTVQEFVKAISQQYDTVVAGDSKRITYAVPDRADLSKTTKINVYKFPRKKYLWRDDNGSKLEYAIRLSGVKSGTTYTSVAYCVYDGQVYLSHHVKSVVAE